MRAKALLLGLLWMTVVSLLGCQSVSSNAPNLLTLTGMSPRELDLFDELQIAGSGFPEGKSARVAFRGDLYRAGSKVEQNVEIVARTTSTSPRSLSLVMTEALRKAFTGAEDDAKHTTFRGDVEVSFTPKKAGSAPVLGILPDVMLDVEAPLVSPTLQQQRDKTADEALAFLGIELRSLEAGSCCVVARAEGRAAAAGLSPGDSLIDLDGVTVKSRWDLTPSSRRRTARLSFRHGGTGPVVARELDVQGYRSAAPSELGPAVGIIGFALMLLLLQVTRLGRPLEWLVRWLSQRWREREQKPPARSFSLVKPQFLFRAEWLGLPEDPGYHLLSVVLLVALCALGTAVSLRVEIVSQELDLLLWSLSQTLSIVWATLLSTAAEPSRRFRSGLRAGSSALLHQLPILALIVIGVIEARSVRLLDLVDAQETFLIGWNAFRSPAHLLLTVLALLALVPQVRAVSSLVMTSEPSQPNRRRLASLSSGLGNVLGGTLHLWASAMLLALIAFGGYRVPTVSVTLHGASLALQFLGVFLLFVKTLVIVLAVTGLRYVAGDVRIKDTFEPWIRYALGLVLMALGFALVWSFVGRRFSLGWLEEATAWLLLLSTVTSLGIVLYRATNQARLTRNETQPNPWI